MYKTCIECEERKHIRKFASENTQKCNACKARVKELRAALALRNSIVLQGQNEHADRVPAFFENGELALSFYQRIGGELTAVPKEPKAGDKISVKLPLQWCVAFSYVTGRYVLKNAANAIVGTFSTKGDLQLRTKV